MADKPAFEVAADLVADALDADVLLVNNPINRALDAGVRELVRKRQRRKNVVVVLVTSGGDADAAYRIARCLNSSYERIPEPAPIKLLEAHGERLDGGEPAEAIDGDPAVAAVEKSTGPRTPEGKARVSRNAYRGGERLRFRALARELNAVLARQREGLEALS